MGNENYIELEEKASHGDYLLPFAKYRTRIPKNFTFYPMHWHEEMEIIYIVSGSYLVNIDLNQQVIEAGSIIILPPKVLHSFKQYEENSMMSYTILFHMKMLENMVPDTCMINYFNPFLNRKYNFNMVITPGDKGYDSIKGCVEKILNTYDEKKEYFELMIKSELFELFYYMFSELFDLCKETIVTKFEVSDNIKLIIDYIRDNYMNTITVTQLAKILDFSEAHFMRYFKKHVGITCIEYINDYRVNNAAQLLAGTNQSVGDIAIKVGVTNVSYFNRMFKKYFGVSPIEYRKKATKR